MSTNHKSSSYRHRRACTGVSLFVLLVLPLLWQTVVADEAAVWRPKPALELRTATYFDYSNGASAAYPAIGAELSLELSPPQRAIAAGLFVDYELTAGAQGDHAQLIGSWARYRYGRWKLSTVGAQLKSGDVSGLWVHASRLQFELRPGHQLSIAAIGAIGGDPAFQLGYKTKLTERTTLSISLGLGSNRMRDFGASTKFVWNLF